MRPARWLLPWLVWGCATAAWVPSQDGFRNPELGYRVARPDPGAGGAPAWQQVELPGAEIGFRRGGASMAFQRRCQLPIAPPSILARHLVIGSESREFVKAGPVELALRSGWAQVYLVQTEAGERLRLETVTLLEAGCALDWLLVSRPDDAAAAQSFERWWHSFEFEAPDPSAAADAGAR